MACTAAVTERQRGDRFHIGVPKAVERQRDGRRTHPCCSPCRSGRSQSLRCGRTDVLAQDTYSHPALFVSPYPRFDERVRLGCKAFDAVCQSTTA